MLNCKLLPEDRRAAVVEDVERGFRVRSRAASLADRHLHRRLALQSRALPADKSYMPADAVVHRLCDVVAKNGCLLLSVPVRGDGTHR